MTFDIYQNIKTHHVTKNMVQLIAIFSILLVMNIFKYEKPYQIRTQIVQKQIDAMPKVISHKGYYRDHWQNTLEGVQALVASNIGGIEIDV